MLFADRIDSGDPAHIAFVDLRDFDAYNRAYGFEMGDRMLRKLVGLMQAQLPNGKEQAMFIAHIGEDRFMLAFPGEATDRLQGLIAGFERLRGEFFSPADQRGESFSYVNAKEQSCSVPLTRLRVVYLRDVLQLVGGPHEVHDLATQLRMRRQDEHAGGDAVITDRRWSRQAGRLSA